MKIEIPDYIIEKIIEKIKYSFDNINQEDVPNLIIKTLEKQYIDDIDKLTNFFCKEKLEEDIFQKVWSNKDKLFTAKYLCIDIENLQNYMDFNGLTKGDEVIKKIAVRLKELYPDSKYYRFGGDEFIIELINEDIRIPDNFEVKLKYSFVDVKVHRKNTKHFKIIDEILFNLKKGILKSSINGTKITYENID